MPSRILVFFAKDTLYSFPQRFRMFGKYCDAVRSVKAGMIWNAGGRSPIWLTMVPFAWMIPVLIRWLKVALARVGSRSVNTLLGTVIGTPDMKVVLRTICHPPTTRETTPLVFDRNLRPGPKGNS